MGVNASITEARYSKLTTFEITALIAAYKEGIDTSVELIEACGDAENEVTMEEAQDEINETLDTIACLVNVLCRKVMPEAEDE